VVNSTSDEQILSRIGLLLASFAGGAIVDDVAVRSGR
jgi:hypothetical protein